MPKILKAFIIRLILLNEFSKIRELISFINSDSRIRIVLLHSSSLLIKGVFHNTSYHGTHFALFL